jgi:hypothetical protein
MIVFVSTIIGFSFALHALRFTTLTVASTPTINDTIYEAFVAVLTIGDLYGMTMETNYEKVGGHLEFARTVFAVFISFTSIILLNVLIAMINARYTTAMEEAEKVWRFRTLAVALPYYQSVMEFIKYCKMVLHVLCWCYWSDKVSRGRRHFRKYIEIGGRKL